VELRLSESLSEELEDQQLSKTNTAISSPTIPVKTRRYTNDSLFSSGRPSPILRSNRRYTNESMTSLSKPLSFIRDRRRTSTTGRRPEWLRDEIKAIMVLEDRSDLRFVPETSLKQLLCRETVAKALEGHRSKLKPELVSFVCEKATKVFALLVWVECETSIEQFYKYQFGDEDLPVRFEGSTGSIKAISSRRGLLSHHPFNEDPWTSSKLDDLYNTSQWTFLSPVFDEKGFLYEIHEKRRIPFVDVQCKSQKDSHFSVVQQWKMHRDHIQAPTLVVSVKYFLAWRTHLGIYIQ
jgi:hypothetical protein